MSEQRWIVSDVSRRLQSVGTGAIEGGSLNEVEEGVFSTSPLTDSTTKERLVANIGAASPLIEVSIADRETTPAIIFDVFGLSGEGVLIRSILRYDGNEKPAYLYEDELLELKYQRLSMSLPSQNELSLDGTYRNTINTVLTNNTFSGYNMPKGAMLKNGRQNRRGGGSTFYHESGGSLFGSGLDKMHELLDDTENRLSVLPNGLAVVNSAVGESRTLTDLTFSRNMDFDDLCKIIAEQLGDRTDAVVRVRCEDELLAFAILESTMRYDIGSLIAEYTDGVRPASYSGDVITTDGAFPRRMSELVINFGDFENVTEEAKESDIDLSTFTSSETIMRLALTGWTAIINRSGGSTETIELTLMDQGGSKGNNATELALMLEMIDIDTSVLAQGFSINESSGRIEIRYKGEYDEKFQEFAKALMKTSDLF